MVEGKKVEVLPDTGCCGVIIRRELVNEAAFTGETKYIMTISRIIKRATMARVEVGTPFCVGTVEALCLKDPLFDLIIGNVPGAREPDDPNPEWAVATAVATRAQMRSGNKDTKAIKTIEVKDKISMNKKNGIKMQGEVEGAVEEEESNVLRLHVKIVQIKQGFEQRLTEKEEEIDNQRRNQQRSIVTKL